MRAVAMPMPRGEAAPEITAIFPSRSLDCWNMEFILAVG
jgi:hypothetical protein